MAAMAKLTRQEPSRRDSRRRPPRRVPTTVVRIVLVGAMCEVLAIVAGRAFDDLVWPLLATPPVVTGAGLLCYRRKAIERAGAARGGDRRRHLARRPAHRRRADGPADRSVHRRQAPAHRRVAEPRRPAHRGRGRLDARARDRCRGRARRTSAAAPRAAGGGDRRLHRCDGDLGTGPPDAGHVGGARSHGAGADDAAARRRRPRTSAHGWRRPPAARRARRHRHLRDPRVGRCRVGGSCRPTRRPTPPRRRRRCSTRSRRRSRFAKPAQRSISSASPTDRR